MSRPIVKFYKKNVPKATAKWMVNDLTNTRYDQLHPKLPFAIRSWKAKIKYAPDNTLGGQLASYSAPMSDLFRDERIVLNMNKAIELRGYAERLIVEAMRNGDCHRPTMELADFWLREKNLIHKLFKVIVPRYLDYTSAFTSLHQLGYDYQKAGAFDTSGQGIWWRGGECILELRGNFLPPIIRSKLNKESLLSNVLIKAAADAKSQ